jgi:hypothetical protein
MTNGEKLTSACLRPVNNAAKLGCKDFFDVERSSDLAFSEG